MAAPVYQAKGTLGESLLLSVNLTYPTLAAGDLLYLLVYNQAPSSLITVNATWTAQNLVKTSFGFVYLYSKIASGSESGTEAVTRSSAGGGLTLAVQVYSFRGDAFIATESKATNKGASDTVTWSAITVGGTERILGAWVVNIYGGNPGTPSGYTNRATETLSDGTYFELNTKDNTSTDGAVTATGGSLDEWATFHHSIYNNTPSVTTPRTFIVN